MENAGIIPTVLTAMGVVAAVLPGVWGIVARYDSRVRDRMDAQGEETGKQLGQLRIGSTPRARRQPSNSASSGNEWPSSKDSWKGSGRRSAESEPHSRGSRPRAPGTSVRAWAERRFRPSDRRSSTRARRVSRTARASGPEGVSVLTPRAPEHAERPAEVQPLPLPGRRRRPRVDLDSGRRQPVVRRAEGRPGPGRRRRSLRQRPPVRPQEVRVPGCVERDAEALLVHRPMVTPTEQHYP